MPEENDTSTETEREMPKYRCHKEVYALEIRAVVWDTERNIASLVFVEVGFGEIEMTDDYMKKHNPQPGGYYVVYEGGYRSWSPAEAFESGYSLIE